MYCKDCNSRLGDNGVCPICGWSKSPTPKFGQTNNQQNNFNQNQGYNPQFGYNQNQGANNYRPSSYSQNQRPYNSGQPNFNQGQAYGYNQGQGYNQNQGQQPYRQPGYNQRAYGQNAYNYPTNSAYNQNNYNAANKRKIWPIVVAICATIILIMSTIIIVILWPDKKGKNGTNNSTEAIVASTEVTVPTTNTTEAPPANVITDEGSKTIMVYIVGSNLESDGGAATYDIDEMLYSGFDDENINLILYTGGSYDWDNSIISDDHNCILKVENEDLILLDKEDQKNMGDPDTLSDFINYCYSNYPAEQYGIILWNHGGGPILGYGDDEVAEDYLTMLELTSAFADTPFTGDNKFEWIGFDACLMASIEVADVLSPYGKYLISSQESEPGCGWDYAFLENIQEGDTGIDIGTLIVDTYISTTTELLEGSPYGNIDLTLSVMDLSKTDDVEQALDDLYSAANNDLSPETFNHLSNLRASTREISAQYSGEDSYDYIDLIDMSDKMSSLYPTEANALKSAASDMIVYQGTNTKRKYGVSLYYPYNAKKRLESRIMVYETLEFAPDYTSYVKNFSAYLTNPELTTVQWDPQTLIPTKNNDLTFSVNLSSGQVSELQNAYFVISREDTERPGNYYFVSMSNQVSLSGTELTALYDGDIIYIRNDTTDEQHEIMYVEEESTEDFTRYLISSILYNEDIMEDEAMYTYFVLETTPDNPSGELTNAYPIANLISSDGTEIFPSRYEIDIYDYNYAAFGCFTHEFTSSEDLTNFNEADWSDLTLTYGNVPILEGFSTTMGGMKEGIRYYGMFVFEDTQGNRHCSNLVQLQ